MGMCRIYHNDIISTAFSSFTIDFSSGTDFKKLKNRCAQYLLWGSVIAVEAKWTSGMKMLTLSILASCNYTRKLVIELIYNFFLFILTSFKAAISFGSQVIGPCIQLLKNTENLPRVNFGISPESLNVSK